MPIPDDVDPNHITPRNKPPPRRRYDSRAGVGQSGVAVDPQGGQTVDPSENVKALSEAANQRQDDLRNAFDTLFHARMVGIKELITVRAEYTDKLTSAESNRVDREAALRTYYSERLELAEAKRIDAIRAVDVNAVAVASQRAADQAQVLAVQVTSSAEQLRSQVAQSAEALRALVATTANTVATSQQQMASSLSERLTKLEQAQYEGKGRSTYTDPVQSQLLEEVRRLSELSKTAAGAQAGSATSWTTMVSIIGMIGMFAALGLTLFFSSRSPATAPLAPQVVYVPQPAGPLPVPAPISPVRP